MKKKILAIFATALILALCAFPCFAYPSQNLTFGGLYQREGVTPYVVQETRSALRPNTTNWILTARDLSREISGFIVEVELPFLDGYPRDDVQIYFEQWFSEDYSSVDVMNTSAWSEYSSTFYFVAPRRGIDSLHVGVRVQSIYTFADTDASIFCRVYPISLNTSEIEATAYNSGFQSGYNDGLADGQTVTEDLDSFIIDVFSGLAEFFDPLLNLEIYGIPIIGVLSLAVLLSLVLIILRFK